MKLVIIHTTGMRVLADGRLQDVRSIPLAERLQLKRSMYGNQNT